ncbi:CocE/NonD family hydrolase [Jiangella muralis]|uniref:CocE/NonD family hydrolase n=1 Tax=Jiangella muralis TaxID=702383 RepID=UPI000A6F086E|nr:CocE/NonD family hydrolase [Jiangella muralis]
MVTRRLRRLSVPLLVAATTAGALAGVARAEPAAPAFVLADGVTQSVYSYADAIRESVWVDLGTDLDADGETDRVAVDIIRPAEPAAAGQRVPVIMDTSPYYLCCGRGNESQRKAYDENGEPVGFPLYYDNYFVPRGYAVALVDDLGTNRSTSCPDGGGPAMTGASATVIDWLNGRATAYTSATGDETADAGWSTGAVGMIGKSADGTVANGVAALGVEGLRTIVPIGAVSSYYHQHNANGAWGGYAPLRSGPPNLLTPKAYELCEPFFQDLETRFDDDGNWTRYWAERDYTRRADDVEASVFLVHGFTDQAVPSDHLARWWDALSEADVPRKLWLTQAGHVDPFDFDRERWVQTLHRWFDRWLLDIDNGIDDEPMVSVEHAPGSWTDEAGWPAAGARDVTLRPSSPGLLSTATAPAGDTDAFTDDPEQDRWVWAANPDQPSPARVLFRTEPLESELRLSGSASVTVHASSTTSEAVVSAALVDYGPATVHDYLNPGWGIENLDTRSCWGESTPSDSACYLDTALSLQDVDHHVLASGAGDLGHWATLWRQLPLRPGRAQTITFDLTAMDHVVPAGHRVGLILAGTDYWRSGAPSQLPTVTVDLARTSVELPVVGRILGE